MSLPPHGATVTEINYDIGKVNQTPCDNLEPSITNGSIIAVKVTLVARAKLYSKRIAQQLERAKPATWHKYLQVW